MCCLKLQDDACAREAFEQAVTLDPQRIDYAEQLANLLFKQSRAMPGQERLETMAKARKYFDYIIGRYEKDVTLPKDKRNPDVYFNRGTILFDTGHFAEALADIEKAMELAPQRYDVIVAYADSLFKSNRYDEAAKYYREMLDSKVEVAHAYFYLGRIYLLQNQREKAKENFLQCVRTNATAFPDAYRYLGDIYREKGLRKEAEANYRKYLKLVGENNPVAQDVLESLRRL